MSFLTQFTEAIVAFGYLGIFAVIFAESGFLLGFFLPGDSLLFSLGILTAEGYLNVWVLVLLCIFAAITGDNFGYYCGKKFGSKIFDRENSLFFNKKNVEKTRMFYEKHGKKTIILARFVPVVRTFAPIMAGVGHMDYKTFLSYNVIGGIIWPTVLLLGGHFLGRAFPDSERYLGLIIVAIIAVSFVPIIKEFLWKGRKSEEVSSES